MKFFLPCLVVFGLMAIALPSAAASVPGNSPAPVSLNDLTKLSPRQFEKLTGKKLRFKDRIAYKLLQWKLRRKASGEPTAKQKKLGQLSLIFGISAWIVVFIPVIGVLSIGLAVAGAILGIKSLDGNGNPAGIIGLVLSGLFLFVLTLVLAVIVAEGPYK